MDKYTALEDLDNLFGSYVDLELENFKLHTEVLAKGMTVKGLIPLTKSDKLLNVIKSLGFKEQQLKYYKSFTFQYTGKNNLSPIRKPLISLFFDDLWEVKITSPQAYSMSSFFTGQYFFDTLRQGVNGVIPKMIKERTGKPITSDEFKNQKFDIEIKLCTNFEKFIQSTRGKILNDIQFLTSDAEVLKKIKPENLFHSIIHYRNDSKIPLFLERLKLWNITCPLNLHETTPDEWTAFVKNLPVNDFGVKDLLKIQQIIINFHNTVDNQMLLTGAVGSNIFERRSLESFNKHLKKLLKN